MTASLMPLLIVLCLLICCVVHASDLIVRDKDDESGGANTKASKAVKMFNFASQSAGAVILDKSPATAKGYHYLLNDDKDKYGISSCHEKKWVVIGLSEDILITSVEVSNYEKYSSMLKDFQLLASNSYPTDEWINLGTYTAKPQLGSQAFNVTSESHTRYLKVKFMTHYSDEALCTLSQIKVYGMTVIASFQQEVQRSDHHTRDMLNDLTAEVDASVREIMENSLREEANQARQEHHVQHEPPAVEVPVETTTSVAEPAALKTEPTEPAVDSVSPDAGAEKAAASCPSADIPTQDLEGGESEAVPVVEKQTEGVCASDLASGEVESDTTATTTGPTAAAPSTNTNAPTQHNSTGEKRFEGENLTVTVSVDVDGGGVWEEPVPTQVDTPVGTPAEAVVPASPQTDQPVDVDSTSVVKEDLSSKLEPAESAPATGDQCAEKPAPGAPPQTADCNTLVTATQASEPSMEAATTTSVEVPNNTCTNTEVGDSESTDGSADAAAVKSHPFVDVVVKKLMEFNLFVNPETAETVETAEAGKDTDNDANNAVEQGEKQDLKNGIAVPSAATGNASFWNVHANTTAPASETSANHTPHHEVSNSTHVVSNVSVFVANATAADKAPHKTGKDAILLPHAGNGTASNAPAHPAPATQEKNTTKAHSVHGAENHTKASGEAVPLTHNTTISGQENPKTDNKSHKPVEHNTTETRPPVATVLPTANKTENATATPAPVPTKTANSTSAPSAGHHNTTNGNGTALNCFETLSFAKFSEKMRLKLQQKSGAGSANGSHSGDSAAVAEAAALAAAAGASAKDSNVFRSLMQKIKTLEVDNAIVEMYTIQLSDCYKTVTKELMSRTQAAPSGEKKHKYSTGSADHSGDHSNDVEQLWRLASQVVFSYTESEKLGVVDTFVLLLHRIVEDNMVTIVLGAVAAVCGLFVTVLVLTCVLLSTKRNRLTPARDEH